MDYALPEQATYYEPKSLATLHAYKYMQAHAGLGGYKLAPQEPQLLNGPHLFLAMRRCSELNFHRLA